MTRSPKPNLDGNQPDSPTADAGAQPDRRWETPRLTVHGDLRELTMGPTPDEGESGNPLILRG